MDSLIPFTTSGSLSDFVDKKLVVLLRDGRKLLGVLRSYDQFANLVLESTIERVIYENSYSDIPRGLFCIRGENVVLCGEIDLDAEDDFPLASADTQLMIDLNRQHMEDRKRRDSMRASLLFDHLGFCKEGGEGDGY
ncbi:Sm-like ribonucleoprotein [Cantharellus anzutake]|uniref:Sm-like ribonucleoprotein n=1 Tax=Cantharellus anzutake TaxID=1750568 RepID=UPI001902F8D9|nr:Sm-like ribonucleoprotein [Cantharellus anzutake]KAF8332349.1 Sm-like ribonucleoprotein [Cantharellus anzutake]